MPREVPPTSSITPLRASACKCSSAALGERKPSSAAISARVGGAPVRSIALCTSSRICCWRSVSLGRSSIMVASRPKPGGLSSHCIFIQIARQCKAKSSSWAPAAPSPAPPPAPPTPSATRAAQLGVAQLVAAVPPLARAADRVRAGGPARQQGHGPRHLAAAGAARRAPSGARRGGRRGRHARHRHARGNRLLPAPRAGAGEAAGADGRDAPGHFAAGRRAAEPARCGDAGARWPCARRQRRLRRPRLGWGRRAQGAHLPARCLRRRRCRAAGADRGRAGAGAVRGHALTATRSASRPSRSDAGTWPRVEIVLNHAGADGAHRRRAAWRKGSMAWWLPAPAMARSVRRSKPHCGALHAAACACCAPAAAPPARCRVATAQNCRGPAR